MQIDSVIFDLDGTLWDSGDTVAQAWNEILREYGYSITKEEIHGVMGLPLTDIFQKFLPDLDGKKRDEIMTRSCSHENDLVRRQGGRLFGDTVRTLKALSEKYPLFIVSNCQPGYIEAFLEYHKLSEYIKDTECIGDNGLKKGENVKLVMKRNGLKRSVYVGDAQVDCDAAAFAGIPFIYARYGFGSVERCRYGIDSLDSLTELLL